MRRRCADGSMQEWSGSAGGNAVKQRRQRRRWAGEGNAEGKGDDQKAMVTTHRGIGLLMVRAGMVADADMKTTMRAEVTAVAVMKLKELVATGTETVKLGETTLTLHMELMAEPRQRMVRRWLNGGVCHARQRKQRR